MIMKFLDYKLYHLLFSLINMLIYSYYITQTYKCDITDFNNYEVLEFINY